MAIERELRERDRAQSKQLKAHKAKLLKDLESAPKMKVTVKNYDFTNQGVPIEFIFQGIKKYYIKDGETLELPLPVIDHINSLKVIESRYEVDEATGQGKGVPFLRQRWSCLPADSFTEMLGQAKGSKGEKAHEKSA